MTNLGPISHAQNVGVQLVSPPRFAPRPKENKTRVVLMLQGHPSVFWRELGEGINRAGHRVIKVHFSLADRLFWGAWNSKTYRGRLKAWPEYLKRLIADQGVTDILYYADRLPYHAEALKVAHNLGCRAWAIEFGYLRPDWLTFEPNGMGALSTFPKIRSEVERKALGVPNPDTRNLYGHDFGDEAVNEVAFALIQSFGRPLYPLFHSDKPVWPAIDYLSWLPVLAMSRFRERQARDLITRLRANKTPFNLVAMQLEADYQIRASSPYTSLKQFCTEVISSFAYGAPKDRHLVFKLHPLDNGLGDWFRKIRSIARTRGVEGRVHVIRGGDLGTLISASSGVVLVNSTVGIHALRRSIPVCATGTAVYDLEGLTHQAGLDRFWQHPEPVDDAYYQTFERALSTIQIKGSFFDPAGRQAAINEITRRLS